MRSSLISIIAAALATQLAGMGAPRKAHAGIRQADSAALRNSIRMGRDSIRMEIEAGLQDMDRRMDSLADTLAIPPSTRPKIRKLRVMARTVRDHTRVRLDQLRVSPESVTPEIWENLRKQAQMSLDSLRELLSSADTIGPAEAAGAESGNGRSR